MQTTVSLKGAKFYALHGYYPEERKKGNQFEIDLSVSLESFDSLEDDIGDTVNYQDLYMLCKDEMSNTQKLLETVALNICTRIKKNHKLVRNGRLKLSKIGPQLGGPVAAAVIEMQF